MILFKALVQEHLILQLFLSYMKENGIFKSSIGDKRYTRLCQPPQRHPVILTDYEKKVLDNKIKSKGGRG